MARLPQPGGDDGDWGTILNDFLDQAHNSDGTLKPTAIVSAGAVTQVNGKSPNASGAVTLTASDVGATSTLAGNSDVTISSPVDNQVLTYDSTSSKWKNQTAPSAPVTSVAGKTGAVSLVKGDVGLGNVDNTSDVSKPISTATQTALDAKANTADLAPVATSGSYTDLINKPAIPAQFNPIQGSNMTVSGTYPNITFSAAGGFSDPTTTKGDLIVHGTSTTRLGVGSDGQVLTADSTQTNGVKWGAAPVISVAGKTGAVTLAEADVANLTTDLAATEKTANKGAANGYASLSASSRVPTAQLGSGTASNTTYLRGDGTWAAQAASDVVFPFTMAGAVRVSTGQARMYTETSRTVLSIRASVGTAPTGASLIVDVLKNGTSIFATTPANRPTITAGTNTALGGTPDTTSFTTGDYITVNVAQIGSTVAGSDLTVTIRLQ